MEKINKFIASAVSSDPGSPLFFRLKDLGELRWRKHELDSRRSNPHRTDYTVSMLTGWLNEQKCVASVDYPQGRAGNERALGYLATFPSKLKVHVKFVMQDGRTENRDILLIATRTSGVRYAGLYHYNTR